MKIVVRYSDSASVVFTVDPIWSGELAIAYGHKIKIYPLDMKELQPAARTLLAAVDREVSKWQESLLIGGNAESAGERSFRPTDPSSTPPASTTGSTTTARHSTVTRAIASLLRINARAKR